MTGKPVPKVYAQKRGGNTVTIISGLHTYGSARLEAMAKELKVKFGCGGTVKNGTIEIQGGKVLEIKDWLSRQKT